MWINKWISAKLKVPKISLIIVWYVVVSFCISFLMHYLLMDSISSVVGKIVNFSPVYEQHIQEIVDDLQSYITVNQLNPEDKKALRIWNRDYYDYWICIFDENENYYNSKELWLEISLIEVVENPHLYSLQFADNEASLIIYPVYSYQFIYGIKGLCFIAASFIFILVFVVLLHRQISYIVYISDCVERMKQGDLSVRIGKVGSHEISRLATNLNEMAALLDEQIKTEKLLKQQQTEMIASLSHDLRTPLTSVISYLEFIEQKNYDSEQKRDEYLSVVHQKALQIKYLIDQLFNQVTDQEKNKSLKNTIVDGDSLIANTIEEISQSLNLEEFQVEVILDLKTSFEILMELHEFYRLIDNLHSNLLKYADATQPIQIKVIQEAKQLRLEMTNSISQAIKQSVDSHEIGLKNCEQILISSGGNLVISQNEDLFTIICCLPIL